MTGSRLFLTSFLFFICSNCYSQYVWTQKTGFNGGNRFAPFYFSIGNKGYAGSGITIIGATYQYIHVDFWEYSESSDSWTQKANIPGGCRSGAAGFALNGIGYVTTGWTPAQTSTTYAYDPVLNSWTPKANYGGGPRYSTAYFTIGNYAYVGMGYSPLTNSFWRYNPILDQWTQVASIGGNPRQAASGFAIGGKGYVFGGTTALSSQTNELWQYDPSSNVWTQKAYMPGALRYGSSAFVMDGLGFIGLGANFGIIYNDFFAYNPAADTWSVMPSLPAAARYGGLSFSLNNKGYIGCGNAGIAPASQLQQDLWELGPLPLPVSLSEFTAAVSPGNMVIIKWTTLSELNNNYFTIERSHDGREFISIARIDGNGTTNTPNHYSYSDKNPLPGINYYRLKQTDFNSATTISKTISVKIFSLQENGKTLNITPNPFTSSFVSELYSDKDEKITLEIISTNGTILYSNRFFLDMGNNRLEVTLPRHFQPGDLIIRIINDSGIIATARAFHF